MSLVRSIVFWGLTLVLAFLFAFAGLNKLTDQLDSKLNAQLTAKSRDWPGALEPILRYVTPLLQSAGVTLTGKLLMQTVGATEVVSSVLLVFGNFIGLGGLANVVLIGTMGGAVFTHVRLNEPFAFPLALGGLLTLLLVLRLTAPKRGAKKPQPPKKTN